MRFIFSILFTLTGLVYVIVRNTFVPIPSQYVYLYVFRIVVGMFIGGLIFDIIQSRYLEKFKINKSLYSFCVIFLFLAVFFYWVEDIIQISRGDSLNKNAIIIENILHFGASTLGFIVASSLAPFLFKSNIIIGCIFLILGLWAQWGFEYGAYISYPLSIVIFLIVGVYLRRKYKITYKT